MNPMVWFLGCVKHCQSPELVDVAALSKIRDDVLHRKGQFLELIMEDIISALYLRLQDNQSAGT